MRKEVSAGGIVYKNSPQGKLWLITQHSQNHNWSFPKGLVGDTDPNETLEAAALREVQEEGGVRASIIRKISTPARYTYFLNEESIAKTIWYFLMEYHEGDPVNHDWEVSEARFVSAKKAFEILSYPADREIFRVLLLGIEPRTPTL